jgi:hypothetical protein
VISKSRHLRLIAVAGGGFLVLIGLILAVLSCTHVQPADVNGSVRAIPDLTSLVHQSDLVVVGQVSSASSTNVDVSVDTVVRGSAAVGQQLSVIQAQAEDGPPMRAGERYVLFLVHDDAGTYYSAGGAQGRLLVDAADTVHPVNPGAPATHAYNGQSLSSFIAAVGVLSP